ncbi:MAG: RagB/SusD family nutrient uptake outer membrane protein [Bacteroidales bacterium]|nr:RagB/SusD family nutrient uptake outer membrane protein [Bacteroidales bacterium]
MFRKFFGTYTKDQLVSEAFYKNVEQLNRGVIGCYAPLQSTYNGGGLPLTLEMISDDGIPWKGNTSVINDFNKTFSSTPGSLWTTSYNNIQRCNRMIQVIREKSYTVQAGEETLPDAYEGEVRFIRALNYFNLVRIFGDVPLVNKPFSVPSEAVGIGRTPVQSIYDEIIIPDFRFAAEHCLLRSAMQASNLGRVTSGAGYTMLAKAYLTLKLYAEAEEALKKVLDSKEYKLLNKPSDVFLLENSNSPESIFEVQFDEAAEDGSTFNSWIGWEIWQALNVTSRSGQLIISGNLISAYKNNSDTVRLNSWLGEKAYDQVQKKWITDEPWCKKHVTYGLGLLNAGNNYTVTRYADVLLMLAEVMVMQNRNSEALPYINEIRRRAMVPEYTAGQLTINTILHERRMELCIEGHRWFDLLRTGKALETMNAIIKPKVVPEWQLLFPIPNGEIQKDPSMVQNPGY